MNYPLKFLNYDANLKKMLSSIRNISDKPSVRGFGEILPSVMIFPSAKSPSGNIITWGNISPNPPHSGSINDQYITYNMKVV